MTKTGGTRVLDLPTNRSSGRDICVHELAHAVMWLGLSPSERKLIRNLFDGQKTNWTPEYASTSFSEYFAELSRIYFEAPEKLAARDPAGFKMVDALYSDRENPGDAHTIAIEAYETTDASAVRLRESILPVTLLLHNDTTSVLTTSWLDFSGEQKFPLRLMPGDTEERYTYATQSILVTDEKGARSVVVAGEADGLCEIRHVGH